ncbi:Mitogen-activated protein kinase kinase kinase YODA [Diplonema papillatum]|nr:Mitogen-activated protein kinase kinase kinase YODA [Diplonema papillatum]
MYGSPAKRAVSSANSLHSFSKSAGQAKEDEIDRGSASLGSSSLSGSFNANAFPGPGYERASAAAGTPVERGSFALSSPRAIRDTRSQPVVLLHAVPTSTAEIIPEAQPTNPLDNMSPANRNNSQQYSAASTPRRSEESFFSEIVDKAQLPPSVRSDYRAKTALATFSSTAAHNHFYNGNVAGKPEEAASLPNAVNDGSPRKVDSRMSWKKGALLGKGAFAEVRIGYNMGTGELMAVKLLHFDHTAPDIRKKLEVLEHEVGVMRRLQHTNIVRYICAECSGNTFHIFMEFVAGGSIAMILSTFGTLSDGVVCGFTRQIAEALNHLHNYQVIHRDIKGANVLVDVQGVCKVCDFGTAEYIHETTGERGNVKGTPFWMAPEVIEGLEYGNACDIWSLGCTMIEMVTAQHPFYHKTSNPLQAMRYIVQEDVAKELPETIMQKAQSLRDLVTACLSKDPAERPTSAAVLNSTFIRESMNEATETDDQSQSDTGDSYASYQTETEYTYPASHVSHITFTPRGPAYKNTGTPRPSPAALVTSGYLPSPRSKSSVTRSHSPSLPAVVPANAVPNASPVEYTLVEAHAAGPNSTTPPDFPKPSPESKPDRLRRRQQQRNGKKTMNVASLSRNSKGSIDRRTSKTSLSNETTPRLGRSPTDTNGNITEGDITDRLRREHQSFVLREKEFFNDAESEAATAVLSHVMFDEGKTFGSASDLQQVENQRSMHHDWQDPQPGLHTIIRGAQHSNRSRASSVSVDVNPVDELHDRSRHCNRRLRFALPVLFLVALGMAIAVLDQLGYLG